MKRSNICAILVIGLMLSAGPVFAQTYIADYSVAKEEVLRGIPTVNVIMWSWCSIYDHVVSGNYLPGMDALISEYGPGGSKIGSGAGQREQKIHQSNVLIVK